MFFEKQNLGHEHYSDNNLITKKNLEKNDEQTLYALKKYLQERKKKSVTNNL